MMWCYKIWQWSL